MEESRKSFETWWEEWFGESPLTPWNELWCGDGYSAEDIDHMWEAWQASRAAIEITIPESFKTEMGAYGDADVITFAEMTEAIRAAGLKFKGE